MERPNKHLNSSTGNKRYFLAYANNIFTIFKVDPTYIRRQIGLPKDVSADTMAHLLSKMGLVSRVENEQIISRVPPTRHDILHPCDIMEDVAVAYDFNKLEWTQPKTNTVGIQLPINKLCDLLRPDIAAAGYCEALTFALVSRADLGEKMGLKECPKQTVRVSNPKTYEFHQYLAYYVNVTW